MLVTSPVGSSSCSHTGTSHSLHSHQGITMSIVSAHDVSQTVVTGKEHHAACMSSIQSTLLGCRQCTAHMENVHAQPIPQHSAAYTFLKLLSLSLVITCCMTAGRSGCVVGSATVTNHAAQAAFRCIHTWQRSAVKPANATTATTAAEAKAKGRERPSCCCIQ